MARGDDIQPEAQPPEPSLAIEMQPKTDDSPGAEVEPEATEYPRGLQFTLISSSLCLCVFLVGLDATILTTAIPRITDDFRSTQDVGWYDAALRLTSCMSQLPQGKLLDSYPVKYVFLVNIVIFEAGILLSGLSPTSTVFIIGRAITGLGFSGISQGCMVIMALSRPLRKRAAYIGLISASEFSAIAIAPILGGALTSSLSWRWCFYINLPAAAAPTAVLLCLKLPSIPSSHAKRQIEKLRQLDLLGFFLLAPAVLCLLLALQWGGTAYRWDSVRIIVLFVLAAAIFSVFCVNQHRKQNAAMLPPRLLKKRAILAGALFSLSLAATQAVVQFYLPIWFQTVREASPLQSGISTLPFVVAILVSAVSAGWLISYLGSYTPLMIPAGLCAVASVAIMTTFTPTSPKSLWIPPLILLGIGSGGGISTPFIAAQAVLDTRDVSMGMAIMTFSQDIGEAVFISVAQTVFLNRLTAGLREAIPLLDPQSVIHLGATRLQGKIPAQDLAGVIWAYNVAVKSTFYVAVALSTCMVVAALLIKKNMNYTRRELDSKSD